MPRKPRFNLPGHPLHLVQRTHHRTICFFKDDDRRYYLESLHNSCERYCLDIHAYVLMPDHIHLLATPGQHSSALKAIQSLGRNYDRYFNVTYKKSVALWENRFEARLVQDERFLLICSRYIELTPVRCGLAIRPGDYIWSSYRSNALGEKNNLLTPHAAYLALGREISRRRVCYRKLFEPEINIVDNVDSKMAVE